MLGAIDELGAERSGFVLEAVRRELERRHGEVAPTFPRGLPEMDDDLSCLVDLKSGTPVRWMPGLGWVEVAG
jgi:hypothetical protein